MEDDKPKVEDPVSSAQVQLEATRLEEGGAAAISNIQVSVEENQECNGCDKVVYKFRDLNKKMVHFWNSAFSDYLGDRIQVSQGDIFSGAPAVDALVSPANSFGFMDGGIDMAYSIHFGWQMQKRLQKVIVEEYDGENLVGNAIIIPAYDVEPKEGELSMEYNEGKSIKYLISAPTMRVPMDIKNTPNAYLAFRAVILAVKKHNRRTDVQPIKSVLCPGLGTAIGEMPFNRCASQMLSAFEMYELGLHSSRLHPDHLIYASNDHEDMCCK